MPIPLSDFHKLAPRISLFTPPSSSRGQLIILCTWLGAAPKHIAKYVALYQQIAPGARIVLIESNVPIITSSYARQRDTIEPAVSAVLATLTECSGGSSEKNASSSSSDDGNQSKAAPHVLLHVFSNGGTTTATQLLLVLHTHLLAPLPLAGLLCDSCPAKGTYWCSYDAMVLSLPKDTVTRLLGALACHCILLMLYTWIAWGNENPASLHRRTLLDGEKVSANWADECGSGEKKKEKRAGGGMVCYFYSKEDRMCLWSDVRQHADEARKLGWNVREFLFEGSAHCAHFTKDEERYADAVKSMWEEGKGRERSKKEVATLSGSDVIK